MAGRMPVFAAPMKTRRPRVLRSGRTVGCVLAAVAAFGAVGQSGPTPGGLGDGFMVRQVSVDGAWTLVDSIPASRVAQEAWVRPDVFNAAVLNVDAMRALLADAPMEGTIEASENPVVLDIPMPDGGFDTFVVWESPVMAPELRAKYPGIRTYAGQSLSDPSSHGRFTMTHKGFDAQIRRATGPTAYIDRYSKNDTTLYAAYYKHDLDRSDIQWHCDFDESIHGGLIGGTDDSLSDPQMRAAVTRKEFRLAVVCTGEYTQFHGGTVADGLAAVVTAINRVSGIYMDELAVKLVLVPDEDQLIYTNPATDGLSNGSSLLNQVTSRINSVLGSGAYDVGHGFSTGSGGVAFLGVICTSNKGGGTTGLGSPIGDPFYVDYVAHEMGHQYGATHTFNGVNGSCSGGNRTGSTAYEPGSGTTIMAYAGICGSDNTQSNSDPFFHYRSIQQITAHVTNGSGGNCDTPFATGNNTPTVDAGTSISVPMGTPFFLTATASDPDGDTISYGWEEYDLGPAQSVNSPDNGSSPLFRSFPTKLSPTRYFPDLVDLATGGIMKGEKLPTTNRTMTFRITVRDNNPNGGGTATDTTTVTVLTTAGPFDVTSQNSPVTITDGQMTVTWDVANTNTLLGASNVDILFSDNAGASYDYVLASGTPNDGSETVTLPNILTTQGRVMVTSTGFNQFFDTNNAAITIDVPPMPIVISYPNGLPTQLVDGQTTDILVHIDPGTFTLDPNGLFMTYAYNFSIPLFQVPLVAQGNDDYIATLPAGTCDDVAVFNFTATPVSGTVVIDPADINNPYSATVVCDMVCLPDVNHDGQVTAADFTAWVAAFNAGDPECDQNEDGMCTAADFTAWVANFNAGCP